MSGSAVLLPVLPTPADPGAASGLGSRRPELTSRQTEIIALVVEGCTNHEIAARLDISSRTVQAHLAAAMQRLHASSRTQLAVLALRSGIVPLFPTVGLDPDAAVTYPHVA